MLRLSFFSVGTNNNWSNMVWTSLWKFEQNLRKGDERKKNKRMMKIVSIAWGDFAQSKSFPRTSLWKFETNIRKGDERIKGRKVKRWWKLQALLGATLQSRCCHAFSYLVSMLIYLRKTKVPINRKFFIKPFIPALRYDFLLVAITQCDWNCWFPVAVRQTVHPLMSTIICLNTEAATWRLKCLSFFTSPYFLSRL